MTCSSPAVVGKEDHALQNEFRRLARQFWELVRQTRSTGRFRNFEGGSVEQNMNPRLLLRHCLNYAATLVLLLRAMKEAPGQDAGQPGSFHVLELGSGSGALSAAFSRIMPQHWDLLATDYSAELVNSAQRLYQLPRLRFQVIDVHSLHSLNLSGFQAVFFLELIEHLTADDQRGLLTALHRSMDRGAVLVFSTLDRSAFSRPYSGYWPHRVEYSYRAMVDFLDCCDNNPFGNYQVWRLRSRMIVADAVRAENRGGYLFNRLAGTVERLTAPHHGFRECLRLAADACYKLFSLLPLCADFRVEEWLDGVSLDCGTCSNGSDDSFGMVVLMSKV